MTNFLSCKLSTTILHKWGSKKGINKLDLTVFIRILYMDKVKFTKLQPLLKISTSICPYYKTSMPNHQGALNKEN